MDRRKNGQKDKIRKIDKLTIRKMERQSKQIDKQTVR